MAIATKTVKNHESYEKKNISDLLSLNLILTSILRWSGVRNKNLSSVFTTIYSCLLFALNTRTLLMNF